MPGKGMPGRPNGMAAPPKGNPYMFGSMVPKKILVGGLWAVALGRCVTFREPPTRGL